MKFLQNIFSGQWPVGSGQKQYKRLLPNAYCLFTCFFLLITSFVSAQQPQLSLDADTNFIRIGEQITLTYGIHYRVDDGLEHHITFPGWKTGSDSIEIVQENPVDTFLTYGDDDPHAFSQMRSIVITSFDSALYETSGLPVVFDGDTLLTQPFRFMVTTIPLDTSNKIADIKEIHLVNYGLLDYLNEYKIPIISTILLAHLITGLFIWFRKRRRRPQEEILEVLLEEPMIPIHEWALMELDNLRQGKAWQHLDNKAYFSEINTIFRKYLEGRFQIKALEETSAEIMGDLQYRIADRSMLEDLRVSLNITDLVKFARQKPGEDECIRSLDLVTQLIEKTKVTDIPEEETIHEKG